MFGVWSFLRQFMYTKFVVVTDEDVDIRDWKDVIWAITTRVDPMRDTLLVESTPIDYLDFASPVLRARQQDGNRCDEQVARRDHARLGTDDRDGRGVKARVDALWRELGL
jgi:4-hydroxy-3-polyprenylbenzoate decarboxylase